MKFKITATVYTYNCLGHTSILLVVTQTRDIRGRFISPRTVACDKIVYKGADHLKKAKSYLAKHSDWGVTFHN